MNTAEALAAVFEYVRAINSALDEQQFQEENRWDAARVLEVFDGLFDVLKPGACADTAATALPSNGEIDSYIEQRQQAKKKRDFARADEIRALLDSKGILLEDTKEGVRWKRK